MTAVASPTQQAPPGATATPGPDWRRWRGPLILAAIILLGGIVVGLANIGPPITGPLDPNDTGPFGGHALADLLSARGQTVTRATTVPAATAQAGRTATLLVTSPGQLTNAQLASLARVPASLLLVDPTSAALARLAPRVRLAPFSAVASTPPRCALAAARLAGPVDIGGLLLRMDAPGTWRCYPPGADSDEPDAFSLIRYGIGARTVTVLATGTVMDNAELAHNGNAALAMNLLNTRHVVWLVPSPLPPAAPSSGGSRSLGSLIPVTVYLVALELGIAVVLTALWRMRRFGPLVAEPLPVVIRASETVAGHGRLYQSRRARGRAAAALRGAATGRIMLRLGLPRDVAADVACHELANRTGRPVAEIAEILYGPVPDDAALMTLAANLDTLERQVLAT